LKLPSGIIIILMQILHTIELNLILNRSCLILKFQHDPRRPTMRLRQPAFSPAVALSWSVLPPPPIAPS
jgi:hypothetical protein